jgi:hypothetical protein
MDITLGADPEEAKWASELARELVSARLLTLQEGHGPDPESPLLTGALGRALAEVFGSEDVPEDVLRRAGQILAALSFVATATVVVAGDALRERDISEGGEEQAANMMMQAVAAALERYGAEGRWF